jgi:hypothetical protein
MVSVEDKLTGLYVRAVAPNGVAGRVNKALRLSPNGTVWKKAHKRADVLRSFAGLGGDQIGFVWSKRRRYLSKPERLSLKAMRDAVAEGRDLTPEQREQLDALVACIRDDLALTGWAP